LSVSELCCLVVRRGWGRLSVCVSVCLSAGRGPHGVSVCLSVCLSVCRRHFNCVGVASGHMISRLPQGFGTRCLRFARGVAAARARLVSSWLVGLGRERVELS